MIINNLCISFNNKKIIDSFDIEIKDSGITCFFGPSGCGKTTLLNVISGIISDFSGNVPTPKNISYIFQENRLLPWINVLDNVIIVINKKRNYSDIISRAKYILERLGLGDDIYKYPNELSGGMKQRVNIARALMFDFDMLIMDEPFKGLDDKIKHDAMDFIKEELGNRPALFVSHDKNETIELADEVFILDGTPLKIVSKELY